MGALNHPDPSTTTIDNGNLPVKLPIMSLVSGEKTNFQFILRLLNTNVDGKQKVMYALTKIKGVGRRYSNLVCKKADVDLNKRAGELTSEELERIVTIIQNPTQYKIPSWFLNRQRDIVDGKDGQILANGVDSKLREDLERLKKIRAHRGLRARSAHQDHWPSRQDCRCVQEEGWLNEWMTKIRGNHGILNTGWTGVKAGFSIFVSILHGLLSGTRG